MPSKLDGGRLAGAFIPRLKSTMANTYTALRYHIVFSTKNSEPWITAEIEERIWKYLSGIARDKGLNAIQVGGADNHVHVLFSLPPTIAVSKAVQLLKGASSRWIHETFEDLYGFAWQDGYGAFTVGLSQISDTKKYIEKQREHHRDRTFEEEYCLFLRKHGIEFESGE